MQEPENVDRVEQRLADAMRDLRLAPAGVSLQQIWYQAGLAAGRRRANAWRAAAATVAVAAGLVLMWGPRPVPRTVERVVYVRQEAVPPSDASTAVERDRSMKMAAANLRVRNELIQKGLSALPAMADGGDSSPSPDVEALRRKLTNELLRF